MIILLLCTMDAQGSKQFIRPTVSPMQRMRLLSNQQNYNMCVTTCNHQCCHVVIIEIVKERHHRHRAMVGPLLS